MSLPKQLELKSWKYIWTIHNFSYKEPGQFFESEVFPIDVGDNVPIWKARVYPSGRSGIDSEKTSLEIISDSKCRVCAKFQLSVLNERREKFKTVNTTVLFFASGQSRFFQNFVLLDTVMDKCYGLMPLTILFEGSVVLNDTVNGSGQPDIVQHKLCEDLRALFDTKKFCDITLVAAGGLELKAHKAILIARSEVFAAMLEHDMEEKKLNRVSIDDIDYKVLEEMIRFMYTDDAPNLNTMAEDLFTAADKYGLAHLKEMCKQSLYFLITIENATNKLIFADMHNEEKLKAYAINFIVRNASEVTKTQCWKDMMTTHGYLITEILICASESKQLDQK